MKKKTLILQFFMVFFAVSKIIDLAKGFYIWAAVRESGSFMITIPHAVMITLLGVVIGWPFMLEYVKSVCDDIFDAEKRGVDMMADAVIQMLLNKAEEEGAEE